MKKKHQSISETPLVADLSLIVTSTLANQRLCSSVTACDNGVASPVEYAFVCAFFPRGDGIRIPKDSAENVGLILRLWKRHAQTLSRQFSEALKSLPSRIERSSRSKPSQEKKCPPKYICSSEKSEGSQGAHVSARAIQKRRGSKRDGDRPRPRVSQDQHELLELNQRIT
jgi:hypothetical protein